MTSRRISALSDTLLAAPLPRQALPCITFGCPGASGSLDPWSDARLLPSTTLAGSRELCTSMHLLTRIPYPDRQALPLRTSPAVALQRRTHGLKCWVYSTRLKLHRVGLPPTSRPRTQRATFAALGANVYLAHGWLSMNLRWLTG